MLPPVPIVVLSLLLAIAVRAQPAGRETGRPFIETFTSEDFGEMNRSAGLAVDRDGILYAGNHDVVLAFDGQAWRTLRTGGSFISELASDAADRVWVAGMDEFGWLERDGRGGRQFVSLRDRLAAHERNVGYFLGVAVCSHGTYFFAAGGTLRWHENRLTVLDRRRALPRAADDRIFLQDRDGTLASFDGKGWQSFADFPALRRARVVGVQRAPDGAWLILTAADGLWRLRERALTRFTTEVDALLQQPGDHQLDLLRDGTLALRLWPGGVSLLDPEGRLLHRVALDRSGRALPRIRGLAQDHAGNLWLAHASGIERVAWPAPFTFFDSADGLPRAVVKALRRHQGRLYVATTAGLFALEPGTATRPARFAAVAGAEEMVWDFETFGERLLLTGQTLRVLTPGRPPETVFRETFSSAVVVPGGRDDVAIIGTNSGLRLLRRAGEGWRVEAFLPQIAATTDRLALTADDTLWIGSANKGYFRVPNLTAALASGTAAFEHYASAGPGQPPFSAYPLLALAAGEPVFAHRNLLFGFDPVHRRFVEKLTLPVSAGEPLPQMTTALTGLGGTWLQARIHDRNDGRWGRQFFRPAESNAPIRALPHAVLGLSGSAQAFWEEKTAAGSILWIGGDDGLVRAELPQAFVQPRAFRVAVRSLGDGAGHALPLPSVGGRALELSRPALKVGLATDRLDDRGMRFETKLEGRDDAWSAPGRSAVFAAEGLAPGRYLLRVRARDSDGREAMPAELAFTVLPAWWQTWWARAAYGLFAVGGIAAFVRWRVRAVHRRNQELEELIATRTRELRDAKAAAESANHAKSAFLANMSHELRTPLNAMLGFAQILRRAPDLSPEHRQRLSVIGRNGDHLLQLINEVLDLSKIEAGKLALVPRPVALVPLLQGISETYAARAADKGLAFESRFAADLPPRVEVDDAKLRQVLHNLLGNAIKFTDAGKISFTVERTSTDPQRSFVDLQRPVAVRFRVTDTGTGIAPEALPRVFEAFYQAAGRKLAAQGTGLGLAISQRIVGLMSGRIEVESAPGRGSTFWFDAMLTAVPEHAAIPTALPPVSGYAGPRRRLLVVDDESVNRDVLRGLLEPIGFTVEECATGEDALARFTPGKFDGILLDLRMGAGLDGYATARQLRSRPGGQEVAIIAISASVFEEDRQTAIDAGCNTFVPKPFTEERLVDALAACLRLEWTRAATITPVPPAAMASAPLPPAEIAALEELAHRGDVDAFRERLRTMETAYPETAATAHHLDALAANFQLGALRQALRQATAR